MFNVCCWLTRSWAALGKPLDKLIRFLVDTYRHDDHTGGNKNFCQACAIIKAHENVGETLSEGQFMKAFNWYVNPASAEAVSVVTISEGLTLHWNADDIVIGCVGPAKTVGDLFINFKKINSIHTIDL